MPAHRHLLVERDVLLDGLLDDHPGPASRLNALNVALHDELQSPCGPGDGLLDKSGILTGAGRHSRLVPKWAIGGPTPRPLTSIMLGSTSEAELASCLTVFPRSRSVWST